MDIVTPRYGEEAFMRLPLLCAAALLSAGCASINARDDPPDATTFSTAGLDQTADCMVGSLNRHWDGITTHQIQIISPGSIYEILPQQDIVISGQPYFVRLTAGPDGRTKIEAFTVGNLNRRVIPAAQECAA